MRRFGCVLGYLLLSSFFWVCQPSVAQTVRIAVASNFRTTFTALANDFQRETGQSLRASFAATGILYAQIQQGAPFDLFFAADSLRPRLLEQDASLAVPGSRFSYAIGRLALWQPAAEKPVTLENLTQGDERLAIANPRVAPYGQVAKEVLLGLSLWSSYKPHLVLGNNVTQVFQYVATENVSQGFVAYSFLVQGDYPKEQFWLVPQRLHKPITQQALVLKQGASNETSLAFIKYIKSQRARRIIVNNGYSLPSSDSR